MDLSQRRTKIVCTIGPASSQKLEQLIQSGMDVARLNFSHGSHEEHYKLIQSIQKASKQLGKPVAILQDLQGPKVRVGELPAMGLEIQSGQTWYLTAQDTIEDQHIPIDYSNFAKGLEAGNRILLDDGIIQFEVVSVRDDGYAECKALNNGVLTSHKGVNIPAGELQDTPLSIKDLRDISFGIKHGVDYIAMSFVRSASDIEALQKILQQHQANIRVIAKLERQEAVDNVDAIMAAADGIMVARGDLGVELSPEEVPLIQKDVIQKAVQARKLVITATQMLESMTHHPLPTRAEVSDVANAILDGTDAIMLSAETASGKYPLEAVQTMDRVARRTEKAINNDRVNPGAWFDELSIRSHSFPEIITYIAGQAARDSEVKLVVTFTLTGTTALLLSKFRPRVPIIAFTPNQHIQRRLALYRGVVPLIMEPTKHVEDLVKEVSDYLKQQGFASKGDVVLMLAGSPISKQGHTNLLKLHTVS